MKNKPSGIPKVVGKRINFTANIATNTAGTTWCSSIQTHLIRQVELMINFSFSVCLLAIIPPLFQPLSPSRRRCTEGSIKNAITILVLVGDNTAHKYQ